MQTYVIWTEFIYCLPNFEFMYTGLWGTEHKVLRQCCCHSSPSMTPDDKGQKWEKKTMVTGGICALLAIQFQSWMYKQMSPQSISGDCCEHMAFIIIIFRNNCIPHGGQQCALCSDGHSGR